MGEREGLRNVEDDRRLQPGTRCFSGQIAEGAGPAHIGVSGGILQSTILASREEMVNLRGVRVQDAMGEVVDRG
jgi:hypothetical protein